MTFKRLHSNVKIFFPDPYMVRVEFPHEGMMETHEAVYRKMMRQAYKLIKGTWGYCALKPEQIKVKDEFGHPAPPGPAHFAGMAHGLIIASLFDPDYKHVPRGYVCFADELDALQFRLTVSADAQRVLMWPERTFTIHEVVETDGS